MPRSTVLLVVIVFTLINCRQIRIEATLLKPLSDIAVPLEQQLHFTFATSGTQPVLNKLFNSNKNLSDYSIVSDDECDVTDWRSCSVEMTRSTSWLEYSVTIDNAHPTDAGTYYIRDNYGLSDGATSYAECVVYYDMPTFLMTLTPSHIELHWNFLYWGNARLNVLCLSSDGERLINDVIDDRSREKVWLLNRSSFVTNEYGCTTSILPSARCQHCNSSYEHHSTLRLTVHEESRVESNKSRKAAGSHQVSISSVNKNLIQHGDVLTCSFDVPSSAVIYQWLFTDVDSRVAIVDIGQQVTIDLCRFIDNNLIVIGLPEDGNTTISISVTCSAIIFTSGDELVVAKRTNFTVSVSDDVTGACRSKHDIVFGFLSVVLTAVTVFTAMLILLVISMYCWMRAKRIAVTSGENDHTSEYAKIQRSTRELPRPPPVYDRINVYLDSSIN